MARAAAIDCCSCRHHERSRRCFRRCAALNTGCQLGSIVKGATKKNGNSWDRRLLCPAPRPPQETRKKQPHPMSLPKEPTSPNRARPSRCPRPCQCRASSTSQELHTTSTTCGRAHQSSGPPPPPPPTWTPLAQAAELECAATPALDLAADCALFLKPGKSAKNLPSTASSAERGNEADAVETCPQRKASSPPPRTGMSTIC